MQRMRWPDRTQIVGSLIALGLMVSSVPWGAKQAIALGDCQLSDAEIAQKEALRKAAGQGDPTAQQQYQALVAAHAQQVQQCRRQSWLQTQAIWLRLYPCDSKPGAIDALLDQMVNRGYNQVNVEVFGNGRVLLPAADNPTIWASVLQESGTDRVDLLAEVIQKGHERGMKVYAWMFTLNFGYTYGIRPDREAVLARNGVGDTTLSAGTKSSLTVGQNVSNVNEIFVDPYNPQARADYAQLVQAVIRRRPDGVLFDYVRYPKGIGGASIVAQVKDLWIFGDAAQQALLQRAQNQKGQELIRRFLAQGTITASDLAAVNSLYPNEEPLWQGRKSKGTPSLTSLQSELWQLALEHARQGPIEFLTAAMTPVQQQGIATGVAFFPEGNQVVKQGYDSRLQAWDRFPASLEWNPMAYAMCDDASCIAAQVQRVLSQMPPGTKLEPVLAGTWQQWIDKHPPLELQMQALQPFASQISGVSHFAFSWQEPQADRDRQFCRL